MAFRFEELKVWQIGLRLSNEIDILTKKFPKEELYSLCSQMKRAADSVVLNIAEGSTGQSKAEFKRFLELPYGLPLRWCLAFLFRNQENILMMQILKSTMMNMMYYAG